MAAKRSYAARPAAGFGSPTGGAEAGQALFDRANLRPERTGLPFVVYISQKGGAWDDVRVKIARAPKVRASDMATVAIRPAVRVVRGALDPGDLADLSRWIDINRDVLIDYWNGDIAYTEDALAALRPLPTKTGHCG